MRMFHVGDAVCNVYLNTVAMTKLYLQLCCQTLVPSVY